MEKWFIRVLVVSFVSILLFASGAAFGNYEVKASPKKIYHTDMAVPAGVQKLLNQRASEGWRLVAVSEGNQDGNSVLVVVFEKE
ncbi:MAG TPA: DUF4177 domain-containing protein [Candidatus Angelobacter sp.]|nr:DUF4177 domain-containing protein [Candidatus Angelobacter sp.]